MTQWGAESALDAALLGSSLDGTHTHDQTHAAEGPVGRPTGMLNAVSTLLSLTPPGRVDELNRLTALAHGFMGFSDEEALATLARAISSRDDLSPSLADRLSFTNRRAAIILIRANRLSDEAVARLIQEGDRGLRVELATHHSLKPEHITMMVAAGDADVTGALLEKRNAKPQPVEVAASATTSDDDVLSDEPEVDIWDLPASEEPAPVAQEMVAQDAQPERLAVPAPPRATPESEAVQFAKMDGAGRRAVLARLSQDRPATSQKDARRALDPTRHDADLAFLTIIEQRDQAALADAFCKALDLEQMLVSKLLDEADGDALMVLARAAGLSSTAFARMLILGRIGMTGSPRDTFRLVDRFKALPESTALFVVTAMRDGQLAQAAQVAGEQRRSRSDAAEAEAPAARPVPHSASRPAPTSRAGSGSSAQGFRKAV
ncbi:MAG: hypothetical protein KI785_02820 [Devosiaceae bacterium]|nr:hypothetical protein [Devosiaceae bacterium MH13]